ncbi:MAG: hypothetical protein M1836_001079 [Candelina mexicana]|nr:MAG: hypothetical protein M1836_001079 [Candelina mexicana]
MAAQEDTQQWIPVYCTAQLPRKVIDEFLEGVYSTPSHSYQFCLITTTDVSSLKEPSHSPVKTFESPFVGRRSGICGGYVSEYTSSNSLLSQKAFVYLDKQTAKDGFTCCIADAENACVRSRFDYSNALIDEMIHGNRNWLQLRNDAAEAGGVFQGPPVNDKQAMTDAGRKLADELHGQDTKSWSVRQSSAIEKFTPVFCTADISLEILNEFLTSTYNDHRSTVEENSVYSGYIRLVNDTSPFGQSSPTKPPISTSSATSPFISMSPELLSKFTKLKCGGESPLGDLSFIILDKHTASGSKTCIVALNDDELEPGLQLVRCEFKSAFGIAYALAHGVGPAFGEYACSAAMMHDGVDRF